MTTRQRSDVPTRSWTARLQALGPGLVTGASDDDPSGVATYAQAGAQFRFATLWTVFLCLPLMSAVQEICDRTALATGKSLGALARGKFRAKPRAILGLLLFALLLANTLNIAADLVAIGEGAHLLHAGPKQVWAPASGIAIALFVWLGSFDAIARVFKWLCLSLLTYVVVLFVAHVPWSEVAQGSLGMHMQWHGTYWNLIVAILGTTISPYLFFWQSAQRVEEGREETPGPKARPLRSPPGPRARAKIADHRFDVMSGMVFSQVVMFAIITATGATLGKKPTSTIGSAAQAASALKPVAGSMASVLFALGFIGTGFLAVPVLAGSASSGFSALLDRDWGFARTPRGAPLFYALVALGVLGGSVISATHIDAMKLLVVVAFINGIAAAPFLVVTMLISGDRTIMRDYVNGPLAKTLGWLATAVMIAAMITGVWQATHGV